MMMDMAMEEDGGPSPPNAGGGGEVVVLDKQIVGPFIAVTLDATDAGATDAGASDGCQVLGRQQVAAARHR